MKVFFFDYDGTLMERGSKGMSARTLRSLKMLQEEGHKIVLCTGRCYGHVPEELWETGFDICITACGALIFRDGKVVFEDRLEEKMILDCVKFFWDRKMRGAVEGTLRVRYFHDVPEDRGSASDVYVSSYDEYVRNYGDMSVHKFTVYDVPMGEEAEEFLDNQGLEVINNEDKYYEVIRKGRDKGDAVRRVLDMLGVPVEESVSFGDSSNDRKMLEATGYAVAVGNAPEVLRKITDEVLPPAGEDSVAKWIENFLEKEGKSPHKKA